MLEFCVTKRIVLLAECRSTGFGVIDFSAARESVFYSLMFNMMF